MYEELKASILALPPQERRARLEQSIKESQEQAAQRLAYLATNPPRGERGCLTIDLQDKALLAWLQDELKKMPPT